jgi:hypothetical protein
VSMKYPRSRFNNDPSHASSYSRRDRWSTEKA